LDFTWIYSIILVIVVVIPVIIALSIAVHMRREPLSQSAIISPQKDKRYQGRILAAVAIISIAGNFVLLGIPGGVWVWFATEIANYICEAETLSKFGESSGWGTAIMVTFVWPTSFIPAYWFVRQSTSVQLQRVIIFIVFIYIALFGLLLPFAFILPYCILK